MGVEKVPGRSCKNIERRWLLADQLAETLLYASKPWNPHHVGGAAAYHSRNWITKSTQKHYMDYRHSTDFPILTSNVGIVIVLFKKSKYTYATSHKTNKEDWWQAAQIGRSGKEASTFRRSGQQEDKRVQRECKAAGFSNSLNCSELAAGRAYNNEKINRFFQYEVRKLHKITLQCWHFRRRSEATGIKRSHSSGAGCRAGSKTWWTLLKLLPQQAVQAPISIS